MSDEAMTIDLPETPDDELASFVLRELGVLPEVTGPRRHISDAAPVLVFVTQALVAGMIGNKGDDALNLVIERLRRRGAPAAADDGPGDEHRPVLLVEGDLEDDLEGDGEGDPGTGRTVVTFVFDDRTGGDPAPVRQLLVVDRGANAGTDPVRLGWDRVGRRWVPDDAPRHP
jgi:hypothetical protein